MATNLNRVDSVLDIGQRIKTRPSNTRVASSLRIRLRDATHVIAFWSWRDHQLSFAILRRTRGARAQVRRKQPQTTARKTMRGFVWNPRAALEFTVSCAALVPVPALHLRKCGALDVPTRKKRKHPKIAPLNPSRTPHAPRVTNTYAALAQPRRTQRDPSTCGAHDPQTFSTTAPSPI